jgi:dienelactone hydrolase
MMDNLRQSLSQFMGFSLPETAVPFTTHETIQENGYRRLRISYDSDEGEAIAAFLLLPVGEGPFAAALVHHQHNGQRHLGKSEVCGLAGDPLQAFGPVLAQRGLVVLAPDSICFEDRRRNRTGMEADETADVTQHYNEMCYRLLHGDTLMRQVLSDSARAVSLLQAHPLVDTARIGILGHSYGGNTALFHTALDERLAFACASGAGGSLQQRITNQTGIEMASVIPGFSRRYDIPDLVACIAPRPLLLLSATGDAFSQDADRVVKVAHDKCAASDVTPQILHKRYEGGHPLTQGRFDDIVHWLSILSVGFSQNL